MEKTNLDKFIPGNDWPLRVCKFIIIHFKKGVILQFALIVFYWLGFALNCCTTPDLKSFVNLQDKHTKWRVKTMKDKQETISAVYDIPINVVNNVLYQNCKYMEDDESENSPKLR